MSYVGVVYMCAYCIKGKSTYSNVSGGLVCLGCVILMRTLCSYTLHLINYGARTEY